MAKFRLQFTAATGTFSCLGTGRSVAWLARLFRVQEVVSSNLTAPTIFSHAVNQDNFGEPREGLGISLSSLDSKLLRCTGFTTSTRVSDWLLHPVAPVLHQMLHLKSLRLNRVAGVAPFTTSTHISCLWW